MNRPPLTLLGELDDGTAGRLLLDRLERAATPPARHDDWQPRPCPPPRPTTRARTRIPGEVLL